jgi:hypothetical protein
VSLEVGLQRAANVLAVELIADGKLVNRIVNRESCIVVLQVVDDVEAVNEKRAEWVDVAHLSRVPFFCPME